MAAQQEVALVIVEVTVRVKAHLRLVLRNARTRAAAKHTIGAADVIAEIIERGLNLTVLSPLRRISRRIRAAIGLATLVLVNFVHDDAAEQRTAQECRSLVGLSPLNRHGHKTGSNERRTNVFCFKHDKETLR